MTEILERPKLVTVFGGSGFVGRNVVQALARRGYRVRVAVRRPDLAGHVQPLGNVGQIQPVQANLRVRWSIDRAVDIQTAYLRQSYEGFVAEAMKLGGLYADMAKDAYRPFEAIVARTR